MKVFRFGNTDSPSPPLATPSRVFLSEEFSIFRYMFESFACDCTDLLVSRTSQNIVPAVQLLIDKEGTVIQISLPRFVEVVVGVRKADQNRWSALPAPRSPRSRGTSRRRCSGSSQGPETTRGKAGESRGINISEERRISRRILGAFLLQNSKPRLDILRLSEHSH